MTRDVLLMLPHLSALAEGSALLLAVAEDGLAAYNQTSAATTVRAQLELAGTIAWLLEEGIEPVERVRRFLTWRFEDVRGLRRLVGRLRTIEGGSADLQDTLDRVEEREAEALALARSCGYEAKRKDGGAIVLLKENGREDEPLSKTRRVNDYAATRNVYELLSLTVHGARGRVADQGNRHDRRSDVAE